MKQNPAQTKLYIRHWHPRKGGWYHAYLVRAGRKWAIVLDLIGNRHRVPVADVKAAVL